MPPRLPAKGACRRKTPRVRTSHGLSRGRGHVGLGGLLPREPGAKAHQDNPRKRRWRQGCQRLGHDRAPWVDNAHARFPREGLRGNVSGETRRSGPRCRETLGPPVPLHGALDSVSSPRGASRGSEPGTHEVRFHVSVRVADVGRKHRVFGPPGVPQGPQVNQALARRKLVAPLTGRAGGEKANRCKGGTHDPQRSS